MERSPQAGKQPPRSPGPVSTGLQTVQCHWRSSSQHTAPKKGWEDGKTHINWLGVSCHTDSSWLHEFHGSISIVYETCFYIKRERERLCVIIITKMPTFRKFQENHLQLEPTSRTPTATDAVNMFNGHAHSRRGRATQRSAAGSSGGDLGPINMHFDPIAGWFIPSGKLTSTLVVVWVGRLVKPLTILVIFRVNKFIY